MGESSILPSIAQSIPRDKETMAADFLPMAAYIFITTFTPGPNNVSAAAAGLKLGLRRTLPYLFGIASGFFLVMTASGLFSVFLRTRYSAIAPYLKWIGFTYMLWLAVSPFLKLKHATRSETTYTYPVGLALQVVNPKAILYGITLYATFFEFLAGNAAGVLISALALTAVGFTSILAWALMGSGLTRFLNNKRNELIFNLAMAALLLYSAISIVAH
ncbi:MAG: LysE family translocator [Rectinemataceae bacterium]